MALKNNSILPQEILANAPVGIFQTDSQGNCIFINKRWSEIAGLTLEEARGQGWVSALHPEDKDRVSKEWYQAAKKKVEFKSEYRFKAANGKVTWLAGSAVALKDKSGAVLGYVGSIIDITERKSVEEGIIKSNKQLGVIFKEIRDGVTIQSPNGKLLYANDMAAKIIGLPSAKALVDTPVEKLMQGFELIDEKGNNLPVSRLPGRIAFEGKNPKETIVGYKVKKTEKIHWSLLKATPIFDENKKIKYVINFFRDITSQKRNEDNLKFLSEASKILSSSLDYQKTLSAVAKLAVPKIADWCGIDLLDDEGVLKQQIVFHKDPTKLSLAKKIRELNPPDLLQPSGIVKVIATGKSEFHPQITEEMLVQIAKSQEHLKLLNEIGLTSIIIAPLKVSSKSIGAITFVTAESKFSYTMGDLHMVEQLAARASLAVENARLYRVVESERKRIGNLVGNVPGVVWEAWGKPDEANQKINFVSDYVKEMLGYTIEEWLDTPNFWLKIVHPSDRDRAAFESDQIFKSGKKGTSQFRWMTKDKNSIWVESQSIVIKDLKGNPVGMRGVTMDISQRKQAEQVVERLAAIVESSDDAIISKTLEGIITSWNPGAERLYGYSSKEAIGKKLSIIVTKDQLEEFQEVMEIVKLGQSVDHLETVRVRKDGRLIDVSITVSPLKDTSGEIIGASTIARDISLSKELERRKDAFIGMASHELKTPITTLKAFTQVLQKRFAQINDEVSVRFLDKMHEQVDRLTDLVSDLLDLSRIQSGQLDLDKQNFNLSKLVEDTVENIQNTSLKHKIEVESAGQPELKGDKDRIGQVLTNLLVNAIKYSPKGDKVKVKVIPNGNKVVVSVQDYGIGISKTHQQKIFDRFYRAAGANEKTFPGLGIGLFISAEIVRRHGGNIWVESVKRKGSTFFFSLPLR
jgi:PAS domain S-box-containing protein